MKVFTSSKKKFIPGILTAAVLLVIWKLAAVRINIPIIVPAPEAVILRFSEIAVTAEFREALGHTALRTLLGFVISFTAGFVTGIACGSNRTINSALSPVITIIRTVPVMSVIILAMIWFKTDMVPVFVCFLMVFPIITANVTEGIRSIDPALVEMGQVFRLSSRDILFHITVPSVVPFILSGVRASVGVAWKSVIAAEVLSQPVRAIGSGMQFAQMNLETAEVIAWTLTAVILSWLSERILDFISAGFIRGGA